MSSAEDFGRDEMEDPEGSGYDVAPPERGSGVVGRDIVIGGQG